MLSILAVVATDIAPVPAAGEVVGLVALIAFCAFFVIAGAIFLKKKKQERIEALTRELDTPLSEQPALTPSKDTVVAPPAEAVVPKASDLVEAEREAQKLKAEAEAKARAAARAEAEAKANDDDDAKRRAEEARRAADDAAAARAAAADQAKSLRLALGRSRDGLVGRLKGALGGKELDATVLDDIENVLFTADIGARTADRLLQAVKGKLSRKELSSLARVEETLRGEAEAILGTVAVAPIAGGVAPGAGVSGPHVILVLGVNGAGKTTTIGKLASQLRAQGKSVLLGAGDTFRAAAADQLEVWAERAGVPIVTGPDGGDPSSVLFDTVKKATADRVDVVLCDTAGRLHTKTNLMEELKKVHRSLGKACPGAPHEVLLVLDGTVGQNAIAQAKQFGGAAPLTGIILTKLDGTAKGGVVLGIVDELKVPVRAIGVGEKIDDLRPFVARDFIDALFSDQGGAPPVSSPARGA